MNKITLMVDGDSLQTLRDAASAARVVLQGSVLEEEDSARYVAMVRTDDMSVLAGTPFPQVPAGDMPLVELGRTYATVIFPDYQGQPFVGQIHPDQIVELSLREATEEDIENGVPLVHITNTGQIKAASDDSDE